MAFKLQTVDEAIHNNGIKICVHGPAGSGKTVLSLTSGDSAIMLSAESGLLSLQDAPNEVKDMMRVIEITSIDQLGEVFTWLKEERRATWLIVDSISEIAEVLLSDNKNKAGSDPRGAYGDMADNMMVLIRALRDLPGYDVMMTAKQQPVETDSGIRNGPMLPGKQLGAQIPYMFDEIFALIVSADDEGKLVRVLQTGRDFNYEAKDRSGRLAQYELADLGHIKRKLLGDKVVAPATVPTVGTESTQANEVTN